MACSNKDLVIAVTQKTRDKCITWDSEYQGGSVCPEPSPSINYSDPGYKFTSLPPESEPSITFTVWKQTGVNPLFARYVMKVDRSGLPEDSSIPPCEQIDDCSDDVEILYDYILSNVTVDPPSEEIGEKNKFDNDFLDGLSCG
jgi:hypothetical protein